MPVEKKEEILSSRHLREGINSLVITNCKERERDKKLARELIN
jgi:hypothetical protein